MRRHFFSLTQNLFGEVTPFGPLPVKTMNRGDSLLSEKLRNNREKGGAEGVIMQNIIIAKGPDK